MSFKVAALQCFDPVAAYSLLSPSLGLTVQPAMTELCQTQASPWKQAALVLLSPWASQSPLLTDKECYPLVWAEAYPRKASPAYSPESLAWQSVSHAWRLRGAASGLSSRRLVFVPRWRHCSEGCCSMCRGPGVHPIPQRGELRVKPLKEAQCSPVPVTGC